MYSSAQVVFLFDVNCLDLSSQSVNDVNVHIAAFKLCCLRLMTELGAQTQNGSDIRWAAKFYDSLIFKPGKTNNLFFDFNRRSYDVFDAEISDKLKVSLKSGPNGDSANCNAQRKTRQNNALNHTACFILNKAIQEALKDYNWDLPDVSSPVNTRKSRNNFQDKNNGTFNAIVVFAKFPQDVQAAKEFTRNYVSNNPNELVKQFIEKATLQALEEAKCLRLFCIETSPTSSNLKELPVLESLNGLLGQFHGSLLSISSVVDCSGLILKSSKQQVLQSQKLHLHGLGKSWFLKGRHNRSGRLRKPQPGPTLVWQSDGLQTEKIVLEVLVLQGRVSHEWQELSVVGSAKASSASHAAMAALNSQIMLCRQLQSSETPTSAVAFDAVLSALSQFNLVLVLQLTCGGLGLLSPFLGSVGCLTILSSSGLAQPPLSQYQVEDSLVALATKPLLSFTQAAIKKALNVGGGVGESKTAAAAEPPTLPAFKQAMLEPWYRASALPRPAAPPPLARRNVLSQTQLSILNRAQRRCCPHLSRLTCAPDASKTAAHPANGASGMPPHQTTSGLAPKQSSSQSRHGAGGGEGGFSKPAKTVSRALQLVNKSKIVTAQQKVKEQKNEEEELEVARERRAQQSSLRSQKSQAIMSSMLNNIQDTTDAATVVQSLINLRDSVSGKSTTEGDSQDGADVFGVAQTIINLALMHVRSANETATTNTASVAADTASSAAAKGGMELREVLSGVMLSSRDVSSLPKDRQLQQFQLHTLLHLETMWLMGYSSGNEGATEAVSPEQERRSSEREAHLEEILRLLRGITLHFDPSFTTSFLNQTVLANYEDTLPDVLTEVFEELNQPLPPSLAGPLSVNTTLDTPPLQQLASIQSSIHSAGSMVGSGGVGGNGGTRGGGVRRRNSNMAVVGGGAGRQVVVPGSRMARLTRATSEQQAQGHEKKAGGRSSVRRSLFDNRGSSNGGSKLSQGAPVTPQRPKRRRGGDKSGDDSLHLAAKRMKMARTPREERKRRRSAIRGEEAYGHLLPHELFTPSKRDQLASPLTPANRRLPSASKGGVLAPGTPAHLLGRSMLNLRRSTGSAVVAESPELKGKSLLTGRRSATGRSSFYSGAQSRNCERARTNILVQRLQSSCSDKVLGNSSSSGTAKASHSNSASVSASSFLFSKIIASAPPAGATSRVPLKVDRRRSMRRALNFDNVDDVQSMPLSETSSSSRRLTRSSAGEHFSPIKSGSSGTKTFPLGTPKKELNSRSSLSDCQKSAEKQSPCTPKRLMSDNDRVLALGSPGNLTPSKRVQFSLQYTPSKAVSTGCGNTTPKSILKTPTRTPLRQTTSRTPRPCVTPSRRPPLQVFRTPRSGVALSPDLFSCGKSGASLFSPAKTPSKSPVKFNGVTPNKQRRSPLEPVDKSRSGVSPSKRLSKSTKEIINHANSPAKKRVSPGGKDSNGWSITARAQQTVVLDHDLDICDDVSQSGEEAPRTPGDIRELSKLVSENDDENNDLRDASIQETFPSSDSAIFVDKVSLPPSVGNDTEPSDIPDEQTLTLDVDLSQCNGDTRGSCQTPDANLIENANQEGSFDKFLEIFDGMIEKDIAQNEAPPYSMDMSMSSVASNQANNYSVSMDAVDCQPPEIPMMSPVDLASDLVSVADESSSAILEKSYSDQNHIGEPLLDIPATLRSEPETLKTNPVWFTTDVLDSSFSSPEIEIDPADRDSVKKCILKRKENDVHLGTSFMPNDGTHVEETIASGSNEHNVSSREENSPRENETSNYLVEEFSYNSVEIHPKTSETPLVSEIENISRLNSALPSMERCSNTGEKPTVLLPNTCDPCASNNEILSLKKPECMSMEESQRKIDGNDARESAIRESLNSNVDKAEDVHSNGKTRLKRLSSSSGLAQKPKPKKRRMEEETADSRKTSLVEDLDEVEKESPSSPVIKSKAGKKKFVQRRSSSDAGCSFTIAEKRAQRVKRGEESQHEIHSNFEVRRHSRLRRQAPIRGEYKSRCLPARKSSNIISSYCEPDDDDFADDDESELFMTSASYKNDCKMGSTNSVSGGNQSQEDKRKSKSDRDSNGEGKLSAKSIVPEKENVCIGPTEPSKRRTRCSKRLVDWSDFEEDLDEASSVDNKSKLIEGDPSSRKTRHLRRTSDNLCNSRTSASSGSVFSPGGLLCDQSLGVTPLQNVENLTQGCRPVRNRLATSYADFPSDDSQLFAESSHNNTPLDDTPKVTSSYPQEKIDKYLSPVRRPSSDFKPPVVLEMDSSSTPNVRIDWKQTKPVRTREKLLGPNDEFQEPSGSAKLTKSKKKRGKKKRVKLKFKKSGNEYEVSQPDISGESLNTTVSDCHSASQTSCGESEEKKKKNAKCRKSGGNDSLLTPLRFTRHMSKDLSITPEVFQKLVSASPNSKISKPCISPPKSPKRPLPNIRKLPQSPALTNIASRLASASKHEDNVWRVESVQGSPTMKTFIRVGNSPSCSKSHLHLASPSVSSMLHLSTSPLLNKQKTTEDQKPKTKNLQALTTRHDSAQCHLSKMRHENTKELDDNPAPDELKSKKRKFSSCDEDRPSLKRLRSRSPVKHVRRRASKRLYE